MVDRAYTVSEIDALRRACELRWTWGTTWLGDGAHMGRSWRGSEKDVGVEEMVRTYMTAGITADQIFNEDKPK